MKFRFVLSTLALWAPVSHGAFQRVPQPQRVLTHHSWSPLYLASQNATNEPDNGNVNPTVQAAADLEAVQKAADLDPQAFQADLDSQMDEMASLVQDFNAPKPSEEFTEAYNKPTAGVSDSSASGKGFGKTTTTGTNKKKKAAFMAKNQKKGGFVKKEDEIVDAATQAFDDLNKLNQEAATSKPSLRDLIQEAKKKQQAQQQQTPPTKSVFNPVAQPYLQKEKPTLKDKYAPQKKKEVPSAATTNKGAMGMGATSTPPAAEQKTYFPPTPIEKKPQKEETTPEAKTSSFPTPPQPPILQEDLAKTYFPPTPVQNKPRVPKVTKVTLGSTTAPKETTPPVAGNTANPFVQKPAAETPKETTDTLSTPKKKNVVNPFSQSVAKATPEEAKPATTEAKKETTEPVQKKIFNPFGQKAFDADARAELDDGKKPLAEKPLDELLRDAAKATAAAAPTPKQPVVAPPTPAAPKKPVAPTPEKPVVDPVSKLGDKIPVDTAKAASRIQDKIKVEATQKKLPKVELPKVELPKIELPKMELPRVSLPKIELPKLEISPKAVDEAMEAARGASKVALEGAQTIAKEGGDWALKVQANLKTTRVEQLDMTYEQAFQKMGKSGRGIVKIGAVLGGAIKDIYGIIADDLKSSHKKSKPQPLPKAKKVSSPVVAKKPKKKKESTASYLDQLESKTADTVAAPAPQEAKTTAPQSFQRIFNFGDIKLPKPVMPKITTPAATDSTPEVEPVAEAKVEEVKAPVKVSPVKATKTKAIKTKPAPLAKKKESFLGNFMNSASKAMKDAQSKAKEETDKLQAKAQEESEKLQAKVKEESENLQASIEGLKKKTKGRDTIIYDGSKTRAVDEKKNKSSKTRAVDEKKNKGPLSFFDSDNK